MSVASLSGATAVPGRRAPSDPSDRSSAATDDPPPAGARRAASGDRWAAAVLALAWATVVVPRTLQSLTAPKFRTVVGVEAAPYSAVALLAERGLSALVLAACAGALLAGARALPLRTAPAAAALLAPWVVTVVRDAYAGAAPGTVALLYPAVVLALWAARPRLGVLAVVGHLTGATAVLSMAMGAAVPAAGLFRAVGGELIAPDKQVLPIGLLVGPFTDSNNLGQVLVLGAPTLLAVRSGRSALAWALAVLAAITWTSSRSSLVAAAAALAVVAVVAAARSGRARAALAAAGGALALAVVVATPLVTVASGTSGAARATTADLAFTNRGYVWRLSLEAASERLLAGWGSGWYADVARYANPLGGFAYHGHNQLVQQLVTTGLVGTAALGVLALAALAAAARWAGASARGGETPGEGGARLRGGTRLVSAGGGRAGLAVVTHLVALCLSCTVEVSFGTVDRGFLLPFALAPLAVALLARRPGPHEPGGDA